MRFIDTEQIEKVIREMIAGFSLPQIELNDVLDIIIISIIIYQVIKWVQLTRAWTLFKGIVVLLVCALFASLLQLHTISWLLSNSLGVGITALMIIFQPELRRALEQIGRQRLFSNLFNTDPLRDENMITQETIADLALACSKMSRVKTGALIVIEQSVGLGEYERNGIPIDAVVSSALLINIFEHNTPLHDGAVIIRGNRVSSATCYLPLTERTDIGKELGTRHRAAIGVSEVSDAVTLVVSEETGSITLVKDGALYPDLNRSTLTEMLNKMLVTIPEKEDTKGVFKMWKGLLRNEKNNGE